MKFFASFPLFWPAACALVAVGVIYPIALHLHLFFTIAWFDIFMHFLGGLSVGFGVLALRTRNNPRVSYGQLLFWGILATVAVGLIWEYFELSSGITSWYSAGYIGDNGMDMIMDTTGGLLAVWLSFFSLKISTR